MLRGNILCKAERKKAIGLDIKTWWKEQVAEYKKNSLKMLRRDIDMRRSMLHNLQGEGHGYMGHADWKKYLRDDLARNLRELRKLGRSMKESQQTAPIPPQSNGSGFIPVK